MNNIPDIAGYLRDKYAYLNLSDEELNTFIIMDGNLDILLPSISDVKHHVLAIEDIKTRRKEINASREFRVQDFPLQLHDSEWINQYIMQRLNFWGREIKGDVAVSHKTLGSYLARSREFWNKRDEYIQEVLQTCLKTCLRYNPESKFFGAIKEYQYNSINYDKDFRVHFIKVGESLGLSGLEVAKFLEDNAKSWRTEVQMHTFSNNYTKYKPRGWVKHKQRPPEMEEIDQIEDKLYGKWMMLREYEYERENWILFNRLGIKSKMQLKDEEVQKLRQEVASLEHEFRVRVNLYENWERQPELFGVEDLEQPSYEK